MTVPTRFQAELGAPPLRPPDPLGFLHPGNAQPAVEGGSAWVSISHTEYELPQHSAEPFHGPAPLHLPRLVNSTCLVNVCGRNAVIR